MKLLASLLLTITGICALVVEPATANEPKPPFSAWLSQFDSDARAAGISAETLGAALTGLNGPLPRVLELDQRQPETVQSLKDYLSARLSKQRIANGRRMLNDYPTWLGRVERQYGVPRSILVALWGIESNYGEHSGNFPVIHSLATLAYDGRRGDYFRKELLEALRILDAGHISLERMSGSWAGAMGQCQFMPSSFRRFAVDANGDGRIDIWSSEPDVLASTANYLRQSGWKTGQTWGRPVIVPKKLDSSLLGLKTRLPLSRWQALGVKSGGGKPLPRGQLQASLIQPDGPGSPGYLVYENFRVLLAWNNSKSFAVAVGTLADRLSTKIKRGG